MYSGLDLILPADTAGWSGKCPFNGASLDRIDSSKGYIEGNVQFICTSLNYMKNKWGHNESKDWLDTLNSALTTKYLNIFTN